MAETLISLDLFPYENMSPDMIRERVSMIENIVGLTKIKGNLVFQVFKNKDGSLAGVYPAMVTPAETNKKPEPAVFTPCSLSSDML